MAVADIKKCGCSGRGQVLRGSTERRKEGSTQNICAVSKEWRLLQEVCSKAGEKATVFAIKYGKKSGVGLPDSKVRMTIKCPGRKWVFKSVHTSQVHGIGKEDNWWMVCLEPLSELLSTLLISVFFLCSWIEYLLYFLFNEINPLMQIN